MSRPTVSIIIPAHPARLRNGMLDRVAAGVARIAREGGTLKLGNLAARRDWGWGPEYMEALPLIAERDEPDDFVLATGETHSVADLCQEAFSQVGLYWRDHVEYDQTLLRPADVELLLGDASKAGRVLGWKAQVRFPEIVRRLVAACRLVTV